LRRFVSWAITLAFLASGLPGYSQDAKGGTEKAPEKTAATATESAPKKARKHRHRRWRGKGGSREGHVAAAKANGPFADVPKSHWAYDAVAKAVNSGMLQGYANKFYGGRSMTRYQMAVVVARLLDKFHTQKQGRIFTPQDIANLEALTIEFADELSLLNVKVSTLEEQTAVLRKDVDVLKYELGTGGPRSPITGLISTRGVITASAFPGYGQLTVAGGPAPVSAATPSVLRYRGDVTGPGLAAPTAPGTLGNPWQFDSREFLTVAQFSLNLDRQVARDIELHAQFDINAEVGDNVQMASAAPLTVHAVTGTAARQASAIGVGTGPFVLGSGRGNSFPGFPVHINEAYVEFNDWVGDSDGRLGVFATPFNVEVNGPSRTYNWTLTPSVANTFLESLRPTGLEFRQGRKEDYWLWNVGVFSNLDSPNNRAGGTLLSGIQVSPAAGAAGPTDPFGNTSAAVTGRFPTPRIGAMSDAPRGVDAGLESDDVGWYVRLGGQKRENLGFGWQVGYIDNGGDLRNGNSFHGTRSDWRAFQLEGDYKWKKWLLLGQYYDGRTRNYSTIELTPAIAGFDIRRVFNGSPFPNLGQLDTDTESIMILTSYAWDKQSSASLRYENVTDETGVALLGGQFWTLAYNRRLGDRGMLQMEYVTADTRSRSDNGTQNDIDINDDLAQINYRLQF
jgi:hypothetical protein